MSHSRNVNNNKIGDNATIQLGDTNVFNYVQEGRETPPRPFPLIPFPRDPDFVSRGDILDQISVRCLEPAGRVALFGLGGVGKSQLAIELAHRITERHSDIWVFWIHAATQARVEEGFRLIADAVKLPGRKQPKANIPLLVRNWLSIEPNGRWIIILDSADNSEVLYSANENGHDQRSLAACLPKSRNGSILLTTRNRNLAFKFTGDKDMTEVGPMTERDALVLLEKKMRSPLDGGLAEDLVKALECIPLAISQAAAYIRAMKPRSSMEKYLVEFRKSERESMRLLKYEANDIGRDEEASNAVLRTWTISFEYIRSQQRSAADLLSLMSFFDRQGIPEWVLDDSTMQKTSLDKSENSESEASDESNSDVNSSFEEDILILRNYCLIAVNEEGNKFEMHRLVQLSIKNWLKAFGLQETFMQQYIARMEASFPPGDYENWAICQELFAHVQAALDCRPNENTLQDWATLCYRGGNYAYYQGRYNVAERMAGKAKKAYEKTLGKDDTFTLQCTSLLALIISDNGRWEEAEKLHVQVMEIEKTKPGANHPDTLTNMNNLASTYLRQGRLEEAEKLYMQVIGARKTKLGADHPHTLISIANLASTYRRLGYWEEAEKLLVHVIETRKTILGADHPDTLTSMGNLASIYWSQGRWEEAEKLHVQVMDTHKTKLGVDHPHTLVSMHNVALAWEGQGRHENALALMKDCLQAFQRVLGPQHPNTLASLSWVEKLSNDKDQN